MDRSHAIQALSCMGDEFLRCLGDAAGPLEMVAEMGTSFTTNFKDDIPKPLFDHIVVFLSTLKCWSPGEIEAPWKTVVTYDVLPCDLTNPPGRDAKISIQSDDRGSEMAMVSVYDADEARLTLPGEGVGFRMALRRIDKTKRILKKTAVFSNVVVDKTKTLSYKSFFAWQYRLSTRWSHPSIPTMEMGTTLESKNTLSFTQTPTYHFSIKCQGHGTQTIKDPLWFIDSYLCKIMDIIPPPYRSNLFPFRVTLHSPSPAAPPETSFESSELADDEDDSDKLGDMDD